MRFAFSMKEMRKILKLFRTDLPFCDPEEVD
jgi:hypothetical protein